MICLSTLDELKSQLTSLKIDYDNITKNFQIKKNALPLFYGSPDFDDLNALSIQENKLKSANVLAQGKIQAAITKLQNEQNLQAQSVRPEQTVSTTTEAIPQNIPQAIPEAQSARTTSTPVIAETIPVIKKPSMLPKVLLGGLVLTIISA